MLHFSPEVPSLLDSHATVFDIPAGQTPITLDITSYFSGSRGFFGLTEFPGSSAASFEDTEAENDDTPTYHIDTLIEIGTLISGQSIPFSVQLVDAATLQNAAVTGGIRLALVTVAGESVGFAYTIALDQLTLTNGRADGSIIVTSSADLSDAFLAIVEIIPAGAGAAHQPALAAATATTVSGKGIVKKARIPLADYQDTTWNAATVFGHPLSATVPINGSYGEWREDTSKKTASANKPAGRPHYGIDLKAPAGALVTAVRRGIVAYVDSAGTGLASLMVVNHGNGHASVYTHVDPKVVVGTPVASGQIIAFTASISTGPHLHLEFYEGVLEDFYLTRNASPGASYDPASVNAQFVPPLIDSTNDAATPAVKSLLLLTAPSTFALLGDTSKTRVRHEDNSTYLVAQIVDLEAGKRLVPAELNFSTADVTSGALTERVAFKFNKEQDILPLFQHSDRYFPGPRADFGYVRRLAGIMPDDAEYQLWFRWDTTPYVFMPNGPRKVQLTLKDRAGNPSPTDWTFGPQLVPPGLFMPDTSMANGSTFDINVRSFMGPFPSGIVGPARDKIKVVLNTAGLTSWEATSDSSNQSEWVVTVGSSSQSTLERTFPKQGENPASDGISEAMAKILIKRKAGTPAPTATENLLLRAESTVFPGLMHEVTIPILLRPTKATVTITNYAGTQWVGSPVPRTIEGFVNTGDTGSSFFIGSNNGSERGGPIFSSVPAPGSRFFVMNQVLNFPSRPFVSAINRVGFSSFIATLPETGEHWISWSARRITQTDDWEFQLRYDAGKPGTRPPKLLIGTVPNSGNFSGNEIPSGNYTVTVQ